MVMSDEQETLNWDAISQTVSQHVDIKKQIQAFQAREKTLKERLSALVELEGYLDDKGHQRLDLPEDVAAATGVYALVRQRKVSKGFNEVTAETILRAIEVDGVPLWDMCIELVPTLDEDKILSARYDGLLTDEQIDAMFPETESFAFVPQKAK